MCISSPISVFRLILSLLFKYINRKKFYRLPTMTKNERMNVVKEVIKLDINRIFNFNINLHFQLTLLKVMVTLDFTCPLILYLIPERFFYRKGGAIW